MAAAVAAAVVLEVADPVAALAAVGPAECPMVAVFTDLLPHPGTHFTAVGIADAIMAVAAVSAA